MIKEGEYITVLVNYKDKINGVYSGKVVKVGRYRTGYCYFKLDKYPDISFPNSKRYVKVLNRR